MYNFLFVTFWFIVISMFVGSGIMLFLESLASGGSNAEVKEALQQGRSPQHRRRV